MANWLTALRLLLAVPVAYGIAWPAVMPPVLLMGLVVIAIISDVLDGPVARRLGKASAQGQLFDHSTDCFFVTVALLAGASRGLLPLALPLLIVLAFGQYWADSYYWQRQRQLRMSTLGRINGILYFVPVVLLAAVPLVWQHWQPLSLQLLTLVTWALLCSTVVSMVDRALAPWRATVK